MTILSICALASAVILLTNQESGRVLGVMAALAAAAQVAIALHFIAVRVSGFPLGLVLSGILAVTGTMLYLRVRSKMTIGPNIAQAG